eukprot:11114012-Alexandrium_andersonii.AAC.2
MPRGPGPQPGSRSQAPRSCAPRALLSPAAADSANATSEGLESGRSPWMSSQCTSPAIEQFRADPQPACE